MALAVIATLATTAALVLNGAVPAARFPVAIVLAVGAFAPLVGVSAAFREVTGRSQGLPTACVRADMGAALRDTDRAVRGGAGWPDRALTDFAGAGDFAHALDLPEVLHEITRTIRLGL